MTPSSGMERGAGQGAGREQHRGRAGGASFVAGDDCGGAGECLLCVPCAARSNPCLRSKASSCPTSTVARYKYAQPKPLLFMFFIPPVACRRVSWKTKRSSCRCPRLLLSRSRSRRRRLCLRRWRLQVGRNRSKRVAYSASPAPTIGFLTWS